MRWDKWLDLLLVLAICLIAARPAAAVDIWITTGDKSQLLKQQTDILFESGVGSGGTLVSVVPTTTYQTIAGFGAAMTDSSAWLIQNELTAAQRDKLMRQMFSPTSGIGLNYLRVPMGASDFTASGLYSYNDNPPGGSDEFQERFSVAHDEAYIIPQLQQAIALNPDLKLMGSPWSAPAWMKNNGLMTGSGDATLETQWQASYALYLKKFVQAYAAVGLPIDALTLQNEPLNQNSTYPTMYMSASQQTNIIKNNLGPQFAADGITTKILAYDHNWDHPEYPIQVLDDPDASQYVAGTAFHAYAGTVSAQTTVHNAHPDKDVYFTEITGGDWATNFADNLVWNFQNILNGSVRNWSKSAILWNLALDQNDGPHQGGCTNCRGVVTINTNDGAVTFNEEFYALGQVTKAVQANAVRVAATTYAGGVDTVAYKNPDGSLALVALNPNSSATTIRVVQSGKHFSYQIPGKSVATFLWNEDGADFDNGGFDDGGFQLGGGSLDAWTLFGDTTGNVTAANEAVLTGDKSLKLFGQFNGSSNVSGASQGITVQPGDQLTASLSAYIRSADGIAGTTNYAQMKIEYYNQYGGIFGSANFLGDDQLLIADATSPNDVWIDRQFNGIVPAGAVEARLVLQFLQPNNQSGAVHIDDVKFGLADVIPVAGDYDGSGTVDDADYSIWRNSFGSIADLAADGNGNGIVDAADYTVWRNNFGAAVATTGAAMAAKVPEPGGLAMAVGVTLSAMAYHACRAHGICSSVPTDRTVVDDAPK